MPRGRKTDNIDILIEQLDLIADRLVEEGKKIQTEELVVEYDNGGGQTGTRENPFYPAYEKLLASFLKAFTVVQGNKDTSPAEVSALDELRKKIKVVV